MPSHRYVELGPIDRESAEAAGRRDDPEELCRAVVRVALHGDPNWAEDFLTRFALHVDPTVRGNAVLGFGHLARLHGKLDLARVLPIVSAALADPDPHVHAQAECARDDIEHFLSIRFGRE
jgi:hypothetical protein